LGERQSTLAFLLSAACLRKLRAQLAAQTRFTPKKSTARECQGESQSRDRPAPRPRSPRRLAAARRRQVAKQRVKIRDDVLGLSLDARHQRPTQFVELLAQSLLMHRTRRRYGLRRFQGSLLPVHPILIDRYCMRQCIEGNGSETFLFAAPI